MELEDALVDSIKLILEFTLAFSVSRLVERMILTCLKAFWDRVVLYTWGVMAR
jgi:hypothetical protein